MSRYLILRVAIANAVERTGAAVTFRPNGTVKVTSVFRSVEAFIDYYGRKTIAGIGPTSYTTIDDRWNPKPYIV